MSKEDKGLDLPEKGRPIWIHESIEEDLKRIYDHYRDVTSRNDYLEKENEHLRTEAYKDEELAKMKEQYEKMKADYYRGFPITEEEGKKINEWIKKQMEGWEDMKIGAIGGRFHYEFTPTSIGIVGVVVDGITHERFTIRELS